MSKCKFSYFGNSGRLDGPQRAQTHPICWHMPKKGAALVLRSDSKSSRSMSGRKASLKDKPQAYLATHVFWVILHLDFNRSGHWSFNPKTSSNLTFSGGQDKVRSDNVKFRNEYFLMENTC